MSADAPAAKPGLSPLVRFALDLGPLVVFFAANAYGGIFFATAAVMAAATVSLAIGYALERKLSPMPVVTFVLVLVFGGLTLWLNDETFVKIRPTIVYTMFATVLAAGLLSGHQLIRYVLQYAFDLTDEGWRMLTVRWAGFFAVLAVVNEIVWRNTTTDTWVAYNTWGDLGLTLIFAMAQAPLILRHEKKLAAEPPAA